MEDILRWGTQDLFQARKDTEDDQTAAQSGDGGAGLHLPNGAAEASSRDSPGNAEATREHRVRVVACLGGALKYFPLLAIDLGVKMLCCLQVKFLSSKGKPIDFPKRLKVSDTPSQVWRWL